MIEYQREIAAAAIQLKNGLVLSLPQPKRHSDIIRLLCNSLEMQMDSQEDAIKMCRELQKGDTQGFLLVNIISADKQTITEYYKENQLPMIGSVVTSEDFW